MSVLRTKSVEQSLADADEPEFKLKRSLSAFDLIVFGVGVVIGAGIFTAHRPRCPRGRRPGHRRQLRRRRDLLHARRPLLRRVRLDRAGLGVRVHLQLREPGRDLRVDHRLGPHPRDVPGCERRRSGLVGVPRACSSRTSGSRCRRRSAPAGPSTCSPSGSSCSCGVLITIGIKESMRVNIVLVGIKLFIVLFVIIAGIGFISTANYHPFIPPAEANETTTGLTQPLHPGAVRARAHGLRHRGDLRRGRARLLRVHRVRRGRDHRRGDQEAAARPADRHHRLADHLHRSCTARSRSS